MYPFYAISEELSAAAEYQDWLVKNDQRPSAVGAENLKKYAARQVRQAGGADDLLRLPQHQLLAVAAGHAGEVHVAPAEGALTTPADDLSRLHRGRLRRHRAVRKLFHTDTVPAPVMTSARIWMGSTVFGSPPEQQVGYGVHQWGLHADDREVIKAMIEPMPNLFTCGEAFSDYQGWVEGALRSADLVLACEQFGLEPISAVYEQEHGVTANQAVTDAYTARATAQIRKYIDPGLRPGLRRPQARHGARGADRSRVLRRPPDQSRGAGSAGLGLAMPTHATTTGDIITVATYLKTRLEQLGLDRMFGVAGNYTAALLDTILVDPDSPITISGNPNEICAGYAADAYARYRGIGALYVTYSVGAFSLLNTIAGSYTERVPVLLVNGAPTNKETCVEANAGLIYSHTTGYDLVDVDVFRPVTAAAERVTNARQAPFQIDSVLTAMLTEHRPGYLEVAEDVWRATCWRPTRDVVVRGARDRHLQRARRRRSRRP